MPTRKLLFAIAAALMTACAGAPAKKAAPLVARCNEAPTWLTKDDTGRDVGIFLCFGEESRVLYQTRLLPPAPPAAAKKPQPRDAKTGRFVEKPKTPSGPTVTVGQDGHVKGVTLPTLGGTAAEPAK